MIREAEWSPEAEAGLQVAAGADMADIRAEVLRGDSQLWIDDSQEAAGFMVTRVETRGDGEKELVIVAGEGVGFDAVIPQVIEAAQAQGVAEIRTHTKRRGLVKKYEQQGFYLAEYVMRFSCGQ